MTENPLDIAWILICAALVFVMQAGFCCLEAGLVRSKNSVNVAIKNLADFVISTLAFFAVGFGLMFGASLGGVAGSVIPRWSAMGPSEIAFFVFQLMFCGAATTIVSGAVAERMSFRGYAILALFIAAVVYPLGGHWAWGGAPGASTGFLARLGFVDFAGSTVVHAVGGWVGLVATVMIGPRAGRFVPGAPPLRHHSLPTSVLGVALLWFGWFGFNAGSALAVTDRVSLIVANTVLAGAAGGVTALFLTWRLAGHPSVVGAMNGALAGLVSITAGCHAVTLHAALLIGGIGGIVSVVVTRQLEKLRVDDPVGAFPVHGACGVWGTLAVALFADLEVLGTGLSRGGQLGAQALGLLTIVAWACLSGYIFLRVAQRWMPLRVSEDAERLGLNVAEHGERTDMLDLLTEMETHHQRGMFDRPVSIDPGSEVAPVAVQYNLVLAKVHEERASAEQLRNRLRSANRDLTVLATTDPLTGLLNRRRTHEVLDNEVERAHRGLASVAVLLADVDHFKRINDTFGHSAGDEVLQSVARRLGAMVRPYDTVARWGGEEFLVVCPGATNEAAIAIAERIRRDIHEEPVGIEGQESVSVSVSLGVAVLPPHGAEGWQDLVARADEALYDAKARGRNRVELAKDVREAKRRYSMHAPALGAGPSLAPSA